MRLTTWLAMGVMLGVSACGGKKEITDFQRKEAAHLASEAEFAATLRDWKRAETVLTKVVELSPDNGQYWVSLGAMRVRLSNRDGARAAYQSALKAFQDEAKEDKTDVEPLMQQVYVLALLGRRDEARAFLEKLGKRFAENRAVRSFIETREFDAMLADPRFKEMAL